MQTYFILEIQASNNGQAAMTEPLGYQVSNQAEEAKLEAAYFSKCAAAVQSSVDKHSVMIVDSDGAVWRGYKQTFYHGQA
jgi:hypothetical protein